MLHLNSNYLYSLWVDDEGNRLNTLGAAGTATVDGLTFTTIVGGNACGISNCPVDGYYVAVSNSLSVSIFNVQKGDTPVSGYQSQAVMFAYKV